MTFMTDAAIADQVVPMGDGILTSEAALGQFRLRRLGARPLSFRGIELAMAMSFSPDIPFWYEVNLYRTEARNFVLAIKLFFQSTDERDTCQAWQVDTLDEAFEILVDYDAGNDVRAGVSFDNVGAAPAELAALAFDIRARVEEHRRHYRSLVGELLHDLDTGS